MTNFLYKKSLPAFVDKNEVPVFILYRTDSVSSQCDFCKKWKTNAFYIFQLSTKRIIGVACTVRCSHALAAKKINPIGDFYMP